MKRPAGPDKREIRRQAVFHSVEKSFPRRGKPNAIFSMAWKNDGKNFHTVEKSGRLEAGQRASAMRLKGPAQVMRAGIKLPGAAVEWSTNTG